MCKHEGQALTVEWILPYIEIQGDEWMVSNGVANKSIRHGFIVDLCPKMTGSCMRTCLIQCFTADNIV